MLAKKYKSEVISVSNPVTGIYTLEFQSLSGKYKYHSGQFLHLALDADYDGIGQWPDSRCFSMQSNPDEETISVTYSVKGSFTKMLAEKLKVGSEVWLKLPYGDLFTQPHSKENTVFIAGGTGITPFLSLFTHESFKEYNSPKIYLGFRSKELNIYNAELQNIKNSSVILKKFYENENGVIDIQSIMMENGTQSNYFISGPPVMIKTFKHYLLQYGIMAGNILTDEWE